MDFSTIIVIILALAGIVVFVRVLRKGLGRNLGESMKIFEERLEKTRKETEQYTLAAPSREQMRPVAAALRELLEFANNPESYTVHEKDREVILLGPQGEVRIYFGLSTRHPLRSHDKPGKAGAMNRWHILGPQNRHDEYQDLASLVRKLKTLVPPPCPAGQDGNSPESPQSTLEIK